MSTLGVIVPCRDEAAVIERKIADLARALWPAGGGHRIVVVDAQSTDGTAARAREAAALHFAARTDVAVDVVANSVRPGKPGTVETALEILEPRVELVVLTDADVLVEAGALAALARAFARDPRLGMACGAQRFLSDAGEAFDRWTARVRRLESLSGRLFSVHGQLLAWRAEFRLRPRAGIAADDLDLMLQVRTRASGPRRVALARDAVFLESKTPAGPARRTQALRRARAYLQFVRASSPRFPDAISRVQWSFYRRVPPAVPALTAVVPLLATAIAWMLGGAGAALVAVLLAALVLTSPPGWRFAKLALLIRDANRRESEASLPERWETDRCTTPARR